MKTPSSTCSVRHCMRRPRRSPVLHTPIRCLSATPAPRSREASSAPTPSPAATQHPKPPATDFASLLAEPTWSVRALLPSTHSSSSTSSSPPTHEETITPAQLAHLLRLSALPLPRTPEDEAGMIRTLQSQLHFVRDVQSVDTAGVEPLRAIRDETPQGRAEATIGVEALREALAQEEVFGHSRRPRRRRGPDGGADGGEAAAAEGAQEVEVEGWDPLQTASRTAGRFFVVRSGKQ